MELNYASLRGSLVAKFKHRANIMLGSTKIRMLNVTFAKLQTQGMYDSQIANLNAREHIRHSTVYMYQYLENLTNAVLPDISYMFKVNLHICFERISLNVHEPIPVIYPIFS